MPHTKARAHQAEETEPGAQDSYAAAVFAGA